MKEVIVPIVVAITVFLLCNAHPRMDTLSLFVLPIAFSFASWVAFYVHNDRKARKEYENAAFNDE